jgi:endoplasmic reticulum-Golgi intermediate compartment protein 3
MSTQLKRFDAYAKTLDDFRVRTTSGGLVTIISTLISIILFCLQLQYYLNTDIVQVLFVDTSRQEKMNISIDIRYPLLPCSYLTIDAMDISGETQTDIAHDLFKTRLDVNGKPKEEQTMKVSLQSLPSGNTTQVEQTTRAACESCYGAETQSHPCCSTCDDVKIAYRTKGWSIDAGKFYRSNRVRTSK